MNTRRRSCVENDGSRGLAILIVRFYRKRDLIDRIWGPRQPNTKVGAFCSLGRLQTRYLTPGQHFGSADSAGPFIGREADSELASYEVQNPFVGIRSLPGPSTRGIRRIAGGIGKVRETRVVRIIKRQPDAGRRFPPVRENEIRR